MPLANLPMNFVKRLASISTAIALAASLATPFAASAQVDDQSVRLEAKKAPAAKGFCARIASASLLERASGQLADRQSKLKTRRDETKAFIASKRASRDSALVESRAHLQGRREAAIAKMTVKATTPEQKAAVQAYVAAADAAAATRKAAIDEAIKTFREGLDKAKADRQAAIDASITTFAEAIMVAEDKAKADCGAAVADPEKVRIDLKTAIEAARSAMQLSLKEAM